jgi:hypothetical protein
VSRQSRTVPKHKKTGILTIKPQKRKKSRGPDTQRAIDGRHWKRVKGTCCEGPVGDRAFDHERAPHELPQCWAGG